MNSPINESLAGPWETGQLGRDAAHVKRASAELEQAVDRALAMKLVSIRLPEPMIEALKAIAAHHGIGYQPMVRDLLGRFIASEIPAILSQLEKDAAARGNDKTTPVDNFMERRKACG